MPAPIEFIESVRTHRAAYIAYVIGYLLLSAYSGIFLFLCITQPDDFRPRQRTYLATAIIQLLFQPIPIILKILSWLRSEFREEYNERIPLMICIYEAVVILGTFIPNMAATDSSITDEPTTLRIFAVMPYLIFSLFAAIYAMILLVMLIQCIYNECLVKLFCPTKNYDIEGTTANSTELHRFEDSSTDHDEGDDAKRV